MANVKFSDFAVRTTVPTVDYIVGYQGAANIQIAPTDFLGDYLPLAGGTMIGDVVYNDSVKAKFGTGADSELYHTGSHLFFDNAIGTSYIRNTAAGGTGILLRNSVIGDIQFDNEFAGNILFNTSNVERMRIDLDGNVGIGTTTPGTALAFGGFGSIWVNNDTTNPFGMDTIGGELRIFTGAGAASYQMKFGKYDGTTFTTHMVIGDDGSNPSYVGIGTAIPASILHLASAAATVFRVEETTNNATAAIYATANDLWMGAITNHPLKILTNDVPAITIDTSQTVTIGNGTVAAANAAADDFVITGPGTTATGMTISNTSDSGVGTIFFGDTTSSSAAGFRYDHNTGDMSVSAEDDINFTCDNATFTGDVRTGTSTETANTNFDNIVIEDVTGHSGITIFSKSDSDGAIYFGDVEANNLGQIKYLHASNSMTFSTNDTERMRITSTGLNKINSSASGNHEAYQKTGTYTKTSTGSTTAMDIVKVGHTHAVNYTVTAKIDTSNQGVLVGNTATAYGGNGGMQVDSEAYAGVISDIAVAYDNSFYGFTVAVTYTGASHPIIYMAVTGQSSEDFVQQ